MSSPAHGARSYVRWDVSLDRLKEQAEQMSERGCADSCQLSASDAGIAKAGKEPLPLKLGELRQALGEIESRQGWLMDRDGVSLYQDRDEQTHLDVVNFGGFLIGPGGHLASQSINAW